MQRKRKASRKKSQAPSGRLRPLGEHYSVVGRGPDARERGVFVYQVPKHSWSTRDLGDWYESQTREAFRLAYSATHFQPTLASVVFMGKGSYEGKGKLDELLAISTKIKGLSDAEFEAFSVARSVGAKDMQNRPNVPGAEIPPSRRLREKIETITVRLYSDEAPTNAALPESTESVDTLSRSFTPGQFTSLVSDIYNRNPDFFLKDYYNLFPRKSKNAIRSALSVARRRQGFVTQRTGIARKGVTISDKVREFLQSHPKASSGDLYKAFPKVPKASIRRIKSTK